MEHWLLGFQDAIARRLNIVLNCRLSLVYNELAQLLNVLFNHDQSLVEHPLFFASDVRLFAFFLLPFL